MREYKVPKDEKICPLCNLPYGFIRCRVTLHTKEGKKNRCLPCAIEEEKSQNVDLFVKTQEVK